jgi:hypothetical protein
MDEKWEYAETINANSSVFVCDVDNFDERLLWILKTIVKIEIVESREPRQLVAKFRL